MMTTLRRPYRRLPALRPDARVDPDLKRKFAYYYFGDGQFKKEFRYIDDVACVGGTDACVADDVWVGGTDGGPVIIRTTCWSCLFAKEENKTRTTYAQRLHQSVGENRTN